MASLPLGAGEVAVAVAVQLLFGSAMRGVMRESFPASTGDLLRVRDLRRLGVFSASEEESCVVVWETCRVLR